MIIRKIYIENFGHFHDFTLELTGGVNRICRENEFGKSTLLEFIRRVLWGYPDRRSQQNPYPARFASGNYGGWLEVELQDGTTAKLERSGVKGKLLVRYADGRSEDGEEFMKRLSPVSGDCYRNIYAITLDELAALSNLENEEIRGRLYGGVITGGGVSLPDLGKTLDSRMKELYKQRNGASEINGCRARLREARTALDEAERLCRRRQEIEEELAAAEEEKLRLQKEVTEHKNSSSKLKYLLRAYPFFLEKERAAGAFAACRDIPDVPERAAIKASEISERLKNFEENKELKLLSGAELFAVEAAIQDAADATGGNAERFTAKDIAKMRMDAEKLSRMAEEKPPLKSVAAIPAAIFAAAILLAVAGGFALPLLFIPLAVLLVAGAAALFGILRKRQRRSAEENFREAFILLLKEYDLPSMELEKFYTLPEVLERYENAEIKAALHQSAKSRSEEREKLKIELNALFEVYGVKSADEVNLLAARSAEKRKSQERLTAAQNALAKALQQPEDEEVLRKNSQDETTAKEKEISAIIAGKEKELSLLEHRCGALSGEIDTLPREAHLEVCKSSVAAAGNALRDVIREYLVVCSCRRMLDAAVSRYEREYQPEVLRRAEKLFADFTSGRYNRIYKSLTTGKLIVCDSLTSQEKEFYMLSRGTREELMIAMRLALIACTEEGKEPLPVVFDDIGVNFDSRRAAAVDDAVAKFAENRQVIWFSRA